MEHEAFENSSSNSNSEPRTSVDAAFGGVVDDAAVGGVVDGAAVGDVEGGAVSVKDGAENCASSVVNGGVNDGAALGSISDSDFRTLRPFHAVLEALSVVEAKKREKVGPLNVVA